MKKVILITLALILTLFLLTSCTSEHQTNDDFYGGESLNADILSSIAESIFNESEIEEGSKDDFSNPSQKEHDGIYYWTESGSVYHKWSDCGHLKNASEIKSGNKQDAMLAGKDKLCSTCEKKG